MKRKILISTGGSGGHVIPAITMHDHLKENYDILISSDVRGLKYFNNINDLKIKKNTFKIDRGNKIKLFNLGVSTTRVL